MLSGSRENAKDNWGPDGRAARDRCGSRDVVQDLMGIPEDIQLEGALGFGQKSQYSQYSQYSQ
jgi:hypothetical protein